MAHDQCRHVLTILAVGDLARATGFYTRVFGWRQTVAAPVYAELALPGGMRFGLYERHGFGKNIGREPATLPAGAVSATELYLHADDLPAVIARLRAAGARELGALAPRPWGDEAAYFADPDGNVIAVARPAAPAAPVA